MQAVEEEDLFHSEQKSSRVDGVIIAMVKVIILLDLKKLNV